MDIQYTTTAQEAADATFDFLTNRPIIASIFSFMKIACTLMCLGFLINAYHKTLRKEDFVALLVALGWIFFYKKINRLVIKLNFKHRKFTTIDYKIKIDEQSILAQQGQNIQYIEWHKIRYILKNRHGYIIPLTGISNAGKFLWLPISSLQQESGEDTFLSIVNKFKLQIKKI